LQSALVLVTLIDDAWLFFFSFFLSPGQRDLADPSLTSSDFCYAVLNKVSRSFAVVIQTLPDEIKDAVRLSC
jgi:hypothetical protein